MSELVTLAQADPHRFRAGDDWFVTAREQGAFCARVGATAERLVDIWHALLVHLDPAVDVRVEDARTGRRWEGFLLPLPELREAVGRLRLPLSAYGAVEFTVFTDQDQLTLTREMALVIYARTDRWAFLLDGHGVRELEAAPPPVWLPSRAPLRPAPSLEEMLQAAAERLGLLEVTA